MSVTVFTPTGQIGSRIVQLLLQAGVRPTLVARNPSKLSDELRSQTDVRQGDQGDAASSIEATKGASTVFWLSAESHASNDPIGGFVRKAENAARAIRENGIARVVFLSSMGAERRHGMGLIDGLGQTEEVLNATDASIVHLRPSFFFENFLGQIETLKGGVFPAPAPAELSMPYVATRDIAQVAAGFLLNPSWTGRHTQGIHGPRDLSFTEVAQELSAATGRKIEFVSVPDEAAQNAMIGAGMSPETAKGYVGMFQGIRENFQPENPRTPLTTTPTSLGEWAYSNLRPALQG
jgi:uncharacterized protein YbjT (DUF2867 family)